MISWQGVYEQDIAARCAPYSVLDTPTVERAEDVPLEPEKYHELFDPCKAHRLGHSGFATTAGMDAHLMQDSQAKATGKLQSLMPETKPTEKPVGTFRGHTKKANSI